MPPPMPLSGAGAWYSPGSQSESASSSGEVRRDRVACFAWRRGARDRRLDARNERPHDRRVENELALHRRIMTTVLAERFWAGFGST